MRAQVVDQLVEPGFGLFWLVVQVMGTPAVVGFVVEFRYELYGMLYGIGFEKLSSIDRMVATPVSGMPFVFLVFEGIVYKSNNAQLSTHLLRDLQAIYIIEDLADVFVYFAFGVAVAGSAPGKSFEKVRVLQKPLLQLRLRLQHSLVDRLIFEGFFAHDIPNKPEGTLFSRFAAVNFLLNENQTVTKENLVGFFVKYVILT